MIIKTYIPKNQPLTEEQIEEMETAAKYPITFDEDCLELTDEQIEKFLSDKKATAYENLLKLRKSVPELDYEKELAEYREEKFGNAIF